MPGTIALAPKRRDEDGPRLSVDQNRRITDAVLHVRIAHVEDRARLFPLLTAVHTAAHADVDVSRQI